MKRVEKKDYIVIDASDLRNKERKRERKGGKGKAFSTKNASL